jgi:hypothetical protein
VTQRKLTDTESAFLRDLVHVRGCTGSVPGEDGNLHPCEHCVRIDLRIQDGLPHAVEDPLQRFWAVDEGLVIARRHVEDLWDALQGAPVQAPIRQAVNSLGEFLEKLRQTMRLPLGVNEKKNAEGRTRRGIYAPKPPGGGAAPAKRVGAGQGTGAVQSGGGPAPPARAAPARARPKPTPVRASGQPALLAS